LSLFWEIVGNLLGRYLSTPRLLCVLAAIGIGAAFRFRVTLPPLIVRGATVLYRCRYVIVGTSVVFVLFASAGIAYGRHAGWLRYKTVEFQLTGPAAQAFAGTRVVAFIGNSVVSDAAVEVDDVGYFAVPNNYRVLYQFLAFKITDQDELLYTKFGRDLRGDDEGLRHLEFPKLHRRVKKIATFNFETSQDQLDDQGYKQLRKLFEALPSKIESLLVFGFADERGTDAENFKLGLRRALAVREIARAGNLQIAGLNHIVASFGEHWPAALGSGAKVWMENRRVIVYAVLPPLVGQ
jgi:outer membrane protein OmpA-like peptidoglycan-associated protein